uniref:Uncharacterized protein n=1 Tax=Arundo donax TaxID=35708 RepID=A0A0A9E1L1_ARUDO
MIQGLHFPVENCYSLVETWRTYLIIKFILRSFLLTLTIK